MDYSQWSPSPEYRLALTTRDINVLCVLAASDSYFVRARVASNPATATRTRIRLLEDAHPSVCGSVINPAVTDPEVIRIAVRKGRWRQPEFRLMRAALMSHMLSPHDVIEELWGFGEMNLRLGRVNRADCPAEILAACAAVEYEKKPATSDGVMLQEMRFRACKRLGLKPYPDESTD